jgi:hypothetical protein
MKHYNAHWDTALVVVSLLSTVICLGIAFVAFRHGGALFWLGLSLLALVLACALFAIRGYTVAADVILVHRLLWTTRLPLAGLRSAQFEPDAMRRSIRTFGNGGFFSFTGFYRSKLLGTYRAFVTDRHQTVILRYGGRTVVVSPSSPEEFAHEFVPSHASS